MNKQDWISCWSALGERLKPMPEKVELARLQALRENHWFTAEHVDYAYNAICSRFLNKARLTQWLQGYNIISRDKPMNIGIICAGNIPLVGFHDIMCAITSGHRAIVKLSHKDSKLIPAILNELIALIPDIANQIKIVDKLTDYDAIIATGSNNSLRYFKSYFGHVPNLFRHNRTSVGIIHHDDSDETLTGIADDVFLHFGLGCRSISKLFISQAFELDRLFQSTLKYSGYNLHSKYNNNFIYHTALFQMNKVDYLTNDLFILLKSEELHSPLSVVYYENFVDSAEVISRLNNQQNNIQTIYSSKSYEGLSTTAPGTGQRPELWDYADGIDTMNWLMAL